MIGTDEGIQIDSSEEQEQNADRPNAETVAGLSKITIERV
jgi:hypothetical protein